MLRTACAALALIAAGSIAGAQEPFGSDDDQAFAGEIWQAMLDAGLAGPDAPVVFPYDGLEPHGFLLATLVDTVAVRGHEGVIVVKRNYGPEGVSHDEVMGDPGGHLGAVTIMFQREDGYSPDTGNWFWAKYLKDGSLDMNPAGMALAGLVGKNADAGCIACHMGAGGDDFLFITDADLSQVMMAR